MDLPATTDTSGIEISFFCAKILNDVSRKTNNAVIILFAFIVVIIIYCYTPLYTGCRT